MIKNRSRKRFLFPSLDSAGKRFRLALSDGKAPTEVQILRTGTFWHPKYGKFSITKADLAEIKGNFDRGVRGIDPAIDYAHDSDKIAAAWIREIEIHDGEAGSAELWAEVEWTPKGEKVVQDKEYRYFSADLEFKYQDNETLKEFGTVLLGAGLTNRPVIKNMAPTVELSERATIELSEYKGQDMAIKKTKSELEALRAQLAEETAKRAELQLKLDEAMAEDDEEEEQGDDVAAADSKAKAKGPEEMNFEEVKAAYKTACDENSKLSDELAEMKKGMAKNLADQKKSEKEAKFTLLLSEGKVVPAQKEAFISDDMIKFMELAADVKFKAVGEHGEPVNKPGTSAQDEVLKLAEAAVKDKKVARNDATSFVLKENPKLYARYMAEMEGEKEAG